MPSVPREILGNETGGACTLPDFRSYGHEPVGCKHRALGAKVRRVCGQEEDAKPTRTSAPSRLEQRKCALRHYFFAFLPFLPDFFPPFFSARDSAARSLSASRRLSRDSLSAFCAAATFLKPIACSAALTDFHW